jgi:hypothetical protein
VVTGNKSFDQMLEKSKLKLFELMSIYEEAIGLKEIKEAQENVLKVPFTLISFFFVLFVLTI